MSSGLKSRGSREPAALEEEAHRKRLSEIANSFVSTPFHDHGEVKGVGVDCATLLKCVAIEAGLVKPFKLDHYSPQFFLHNSEERYIGWIEKFAHEIPLEDAKPGDIVLYKPKSALCFCHGAWIVEPGWPNIIHAHYIARRVRRDNGLQPRLGSPIEKVKFFSLFPLQGAPKKKSIA